MLWPEWRALHKWGEQVASIHRPRVPIVLQPSLGTQGGWGSAKASGQLPRQWTRLGLHEALPREPPDGQGPGELTRLFLEVSDEAAGPRS